jgi:hypothetical protein
MVGEYGYVLSTSPLYHQHEGLHGGLSTQGKHFSIVEDAPVAFEHGHRRRVMGTFQGMVLRVDSQRDSLSIGSTSSKPCDMVVVQCSSRRFIFGVVSVCSAPIYQEIKVNKFMLGLNVRIQLLLRVLECGEPHYQRDCPM